MRPKFPSAFELFYAVIEGTADEVRERLIAGDDPNARADDRRTPITFAIRSASDHSKAYLLFEAGARIDVSDEFGMQPIHWATGSIYHDDVGALSWLLDGGANPGVAVRLSKVLQFHAVGSTPLHIAVDQASPAATQLLLDRGADIDARSADGSAPLHVAATKFRVYKRLIRMMLDAGADIDAADSAGRTPLHLLAGSYARYRKSAIRLLRFRNARLDARDANGLRAADLVRDGLPATVEIRRLLEADPADPPSTDYPR